VENEVDRLLDEDKAADRVEESKLFLQLSDLLV
jgi:hypothetical protein